MINNRFFFFLFCFLLNPWSVKTFTQDNTGINQLSARYKKMFIAALKESKIGAYDKSLKKIEKIVNAYPDFTEGHLKKAGLYYNLKQTDKAIQSLNYVISKFPESDKEMYFTRGYILFENKNYSASATDFLRFIKFDSLDNNRKIKAQGFYEVATFRDSLIKNPVNFQPILLPPQINSLSSEYSPSLELDGSSIVFTRRKNHQEDLYRSFIDSLGNFSAAIPLDDINTSSNEGAHCISADGTLILFTGCDRDVLFRGCDLYFTILQDEKWTKPSNIGKMINTPAWESQPCLSSDGNTLFFVSDRVGGQGGRDIWFSKKNVRGVWMDPENIGSHINTSRDDETPFLHPDGRTLYWRSNGRLGMGDFDIYMSKWNEDEQMWSEVKNIGYPVNTDGNEGALIVSLDGSTAYFSTDYFSKSLQNGKSGLDICYFELPPFAKADPTTFVKCKVRDGVTKKPVSASIEIVRQNNNVLFYNDETNVSGIALIPLHYKNKYILHVTKRNYIFYSAHIDLDRIYNSLEPLELDVEIFPLIKNEESKPVILNNIFFKTGSFELLPESQTEIKLLYNLLTSNPQIHITITGHTDNVGQNEDNIILSLNRANSVKKALVEKGIKETRIQVDGKGQSVPVDTNNTQEGRKNNRRTEFTIHH
ncbi:MAG: PD40 domain-containing protein [Saprospiraceae bacterium]|nr:PD40 domain-containing protein [Saprospiraceae bacterium]MBK8853292.1 PD40 domain-containing protein [Saprospiraceae bacterium]